MKVSYVGTIEPILFRNDFLTVYLLRVLFVFPMLIQLRHENNLHYGSEIKKPTLNGSTEMD